MAVNQFKTFGHQRACILGDENLEQSGIRDNPLQVGINQGLTAFGEFAVAQPHPVFQYSFEYTVDNTDLTENSIVNGGTVIQDSGMAVVSSSTVTGSSALLESHHHGKYQAGQGGLGRFTAKFTTGVVGTEQYIGLLDEPGSTAAFENGYAIGFDGIEFGVHRFQNDVKFTVDLEDCDDPLDGTGKSGMTIDLTKINVFEIRFQYLGAGAISFYVEDDSTGLFVIFHKILYANKNTVPSTFNPNFHFSIWVANKTTTSDLILSCSSIGYFIEGITEDIEIHHPQNSTGIQQQTGVTTEIAIVTIRVRELYASRQNYIDIRMENLVAAIEASSANNLGSVRLIRDATLGGVPSYSDINTNNSIAEFDVSGTTVTGGKHLMAFPLAGKNDKIIENLVPYKIRLKHGQSLTIAGTSANSATINVSLLWEELF